MQLHQAKKKILTVPFHFPRFNIVKWELNVGKDSPETRKLPVKETEKIQLQACGMQFHLSGIFFIFTNEYPLFSFCLQMIKQSQHKFRTGNRAKQKSSLERGRKRRCEAAEPFEIELQLLQAGWAEWGK